MRKQKIKIQREGGFMGLVAQKDIDLELLSSEEQAAINNLFEKNETDTTQKGVVNAPNEQTTTSEKNATPDKVSETNQGTRGLENAEKQADAPVKSAPPMMQQRNMPDSIRYTVKKKVNGKMTVQIFDDSNIPPHLYDFFSKYLD